MSKSEQSSIIEMSSDCCGVYKMYTKPKIRSKVDFNCIRINFNKFHTLYTSATLIYLIVKTSWYMSHRVKIIISRTWLGDEVIFVYLYFVNYPMPICYYPFVHTTGVTQEYVDWPYVYELYVSWMVVV